VKSLLGKTLKSGCLLPINGQFSMPKMRLMAKNASSCNEGRGFLGLVSPGWWKSLDSSVVSCKSVNSGLDKNESEFAVSIGSEFLNMLSDIDSLLDHVEEIFWDRWGDTLNLQDSEDLGSGDSLNLRNTMLISQNDTDLRRRLTSLGHLDDFFSQI
jgi:hypothetical protein